MATLNYNWQEINSWSFSYSGATVTFYVDAKLSSQSIAGNSSVIDTRLRSVLSGYYMQSSGYNFQLSGSGGTSGSGVWNFATETILIGQYTQGHNADGSGSSYIHAYVGSSGIGIDHSIDTTVSLPSIPRQANITNAPNFNDEENPVVSYSNPAGNSVSSLQIRIENTTGTTAYVDYRDVSKTGNSYTFNLTETERETLRNATPNGSSMTVRFNLKTVLGGNTYNSIVNKTMSIVNGNPTFEDFNYSTNLNELTGNYKTIINGKTTTTITIPASKKATGNKGASILRYSFECGSSSNLANYSDSEISVLLTNCNSDIIRVTAIDSRGFETTVNKIVPNFKNYYSPTFVSGNVERQDGIEETVFLDTKLNFWNYTFGSARNSIEYLKYRVKESSSETYSNWFNLNVGSLVINKEEATLTDARIYLDGISEGFTIGTTYDVQLQVIDKIDTVESGNYVIYDGQVAFSILRDNNGEYHIGINGMPDLNSTLKVHGTISNE